MLPLHSQDQDQDQGEHLRTMPIFCHWVKCRSVSQSLNTTESWSGEVLPLVVKEVLRGSVGEGIIRGSAGLSDAMAVVETGQGAPRRTVRGRSSIIAGLDLESAVRGARLGRTKVQRDRND